MMTRDAMQVIVDTAQPIGAFRNDWRQRWVSIYADPTDPTMVVTVGVPFPGTVNDVNNSIVYTHEPRADFATYIGSFNKVFK